MIVRRVEIEALEARIVRDGGESVCLKCNVKCDFVTASRETWDTPGHEAFWNCPECGIGRDDADLFPRLDEE